MDSTDNHVHDDLLDFAIIGASHMARGITDFASWSVVMLAEEGSESLRPFLPMIFDNSKKILERTQNIFEAAQQRRHKIATKGTKASMREISRDAYDMKPRGIAGMSASTSLG
jgi:hypothetical protein